MEHINNISRAPHLTTPASCNTHTKSYQHFVCSKQYQQLTWQGLALCALTQSAMVCSTEMHVWSSGAGEPKGQSRVGGMSVHTSPLAGLLHVSNKVPYLHTSRVSMEVQVHKCQKRGPDRVIDRHYNTTRQWSECMKQLGHASVSAAL